jgi:hypothetical protein
MHLDCGATPLSLGDTSFMGLSVILLHAMGGLPGGGLTYLCLGGGGVCMRVLTWSMVDSLFGLAGLSLLLSHVNCKQVLHNNYWLHSPSISRVCSIFSWIVLAFLITFLAFLLAGVVVAVGADEVIAVALLLRCCWRCFFVAVLLLFCCYWRCCWHC